MTVRAAPWSAVAQATALVFLLLHICRLSRRQKGRYHPFISPRAYLSTEPTAEGGSLRYRTPRRFAHRLRSWQAARLVLGGELIFSRSHPASQSKVCWGHWQSPQTVCH